MTLYEVFAAKNKWPKMRICSWSTCHIISDIAEYSLAMSVDDLMEKFYIKTRKNKSKQMEMVLYLYATFSSQAMKSGITNYFYPVGGQFPFVFPRKF